MKIIRLAWALVVTSVLASAQTPSLDTFTNPILPTGPDPWILTWNGNYYFTATTGANLTIWRSTDITDLRHADKKVIWSPEPGKPWSRAIWAPELHRWNDKWYLYFAATDGSPKDRRLFVLENAAKNPMDGTWVMKGKVADASDHWAIDPDIFEVNGTHYILWSGWPGDDRGMQQIYIARLSNPWTIDSPRTLISTPTYDWEKHTEGLKNDTPSLINEGPEAIIHGDKVFVVYSASGCWTDEYELGVLSASTKSDLLLTSSWTKDEHPIFKENPGAHVYGPGHNGFFKSLDGKEDWIVYHANSEPSQGCSSTRSPRIQRFTWNADGTPNFGEPVSTETPLRKPNEDTTSAQHTP